MPKLDLLCATIWGSGVLLGGGGGGFQGVPGNYGVFREVTGCSGGLRGVLRGWGGGGGGSGWVPGFTDTRFIMLNLLYYVEQTRLYLKQIAN